MADGAQVGTGGGGEEEFPKVRVGIVAVDVRTGKVVHDTFVESSGQRQELDTRLRHLRSVQDYYSVGCKFLAVLGFGA